ncbi:hypothetical protein ECTOBSL9_2462 [Ectothiorhodospira sp. BSL-9]|nr:hypothetical protein ECTOBSL9_2462 [Ectothiorhodospira sp. BSL-9]
MTLSMRIKIIPWVALALSWLVLAPVQAQTIILQEGESWERGGVQVWCGPPPSSVRPIVITECQFWDDFDRTCLFERRIHRVGSQECVEECQHWDDFSSTCDFETRCEFHPDQGVFVHTRCEQFDDFFRTCERERARILQ